MRRMIDLALIAMVVGLLGCEKGMDSDADEIQRAKTEQFMQEADRQIGMPAIKNFQERKLAKMIFELRDQEDLVCYAYIVSLQGELVFLGKCIGYGLPYSVQYTNPQRPWMEDGSSSVRDVGFALPQPDPNGLFMPDGLSATWIMLIDPNTGKPRPVYVEPQIIVSPFPLHK